MPAKLGVSENADEPTPIVVLDEVGSTNTEALRRASSGEQGPFWIRALRQTAGRGRSGRAWSSLEGNLAATLLIAPDSPLQLLHQLSLVTGVAVHEAIMQLAGGQAGVRARTCEITLKWPNDILAGDAKLGGILIESTTIAGRPVTAIGIGVNIVEAPRIEGRKTASLAALGIAGDAEGLLRAIDRAMSKALGDWQSGTGFGATRASWLQRCGVLGRMIEVRTGAETVSGAFAGIDETGALLVDSVPPNSRGQRRFTFGDVNLLAPTPQGSN